MVHAPQGLDTSPQAETASRLAAHSPWCQMRIGPKLEALRARPHFAAAMLHKLPDFGRAIVAQWALACVRRTPVEISSQSGPERNADGVAMSY